MNPKLGEIVNERTNIVFEVVKIKEGGYQFAVNNNSLVPKFIVGYRNDELIPKFDSKEILIWGPRKLLRIEKNVVMAGTIGLESDAIKLYQAAVINNFSKWMAVELANK